MGPGPSEVSDRVLRAMSAPLLGHLDPAFLALMDRVQAMLRGLFGTRNRMTLPISGTGSAGMETCFVNLIEPGDTALVGVAGVFGGRMAEVASRCGARVVTVETEWGTAIPEARMIEAVRRERPRVVAFVHAETSTGVHQPVEAIAAAARDVGAFTILDCVTSLGGMPVEIDRWGIDAAYSGTQKCLSAPPGLSPVTLSERALEKVLARETAVRSWYLDLSLLAGYWGGERAYHHTAPITMNYALYEALRVVFEEGLEARFARHREVHDALAAGMGGLGLLFASEDGRRLPMLNAIRVPVGVDEGAVRRTLLERHGIEIGAGLGPLKGKIWRVGLMGASATLNHVLLFLAALERALGDQGYRPASSGPGADLAPAGADR